MNLSLDEQIQLIDKAGYRYEYEERAAILEYDGKIERKEAEKRAALEIINKFNITTQGVLP